MPKIGYPNNPLKLKKKLATRYIFIKFAAPWYEGLKNNNKNGSIMKKPIKYITNIIILRYIAFFKEFPKSEDLLYLEYKFGGIEPQRTLKAL